MASPARKSRPPCSPLPGFHCGILPSIPAFQSFNWRSTIFSFSFFWIPAKCLSMLSLAIRDLFLFLWRSSPYHQTAAYWPAYSLEGRTFSLPPADDRVYSSPAPLLFFSQKLIKVFLSFCLNLFWNLFINKTVTTKGELWISQVAHFPWDTVSNKQPSNNNKNEQTRRESFPLHDHIWFPYVCLEADGLYKLPSTSPFSRRAGKPLNDVWQHLLRLAQARPGAKEEKAFFRLEFSQGPRNDGESETYTQVVKVLLLLMPFNGQKGQLCQHSCYWVSNSCGLFLSSASVSLAAGYTDTTSPILYPDLILPWSACCIPYSEFKDAAKICLFP